MKIEIKLTDDNSHTLFVPDLNETYHSKHGAIQESMHVFVNAGLGYFNQDKLTVLEVGFGTGLNAILSSVFALENAVLVDYTGVEAYPINNEITQQLNYANLIEGVSEEQFLNLHYLRWNEKTKISNYFSLTKLNKSIKDFELDNNFDVVFFDAFGPNVQPEMWDKSIFENLFNSLKENGVLVTYCAKGSVKRTLKEVGFTIENLPGPPGKREMTRAIKY
ncbi:tRNA (5-methylaminomethyl-2-thiouridine)(34)-methyltransferase MnmD [Vicingus serpentipes]|uniref:tRNA (5-methylaminomethyl-2-thiouridine)(34)-methyltransferase MnmD n=1 Tax=Vicingus serpentipes TaxID=1926625 RepID=A0A5C6RWV7_9FLAO|nr:tRNA (5-methylaminomethyl-2-thiouridine)(34)-methyltransferase MnmD [Vicingus serpentipes]TXB66673.1 tRNA (5-methylaminomethyl-2-thiouridine)(34)-methyltransferase MnmD [Vicingus serpentipes]